MKICKLMLVACLLGFALGCVEEDARVQRAQAPQPVPQVDRHVSELDYIPGVGVADVMKVVNQNGLKLTEANEPSETKVSETLIIVENFFSNFYRKEEGAIEIGMSVTGLKNNLGTVGIKVQSFVAKPNKRKMKKAFDKIVSELPSALFVGKVRRTNFKKVLTQHRKGIYRDQINGIDYTYLDLHSEISIDIAKEGN